MLRAINGLMTFCVVLLAGIGTGAVWLDREFAKPGPLAETKLFVVRRGEGARDIAQRLESEGVVTSQHIFVAYYVARSTLAMFGQPPLQLKAGDYQFEPNQSIREVANEMAEGRSVLASVTIPEGLTSYQVVERIKADPGLTGQIANIPPEGSLMPDTYKVPRGAPRTAAIDLMQQESRKFLEKAWAERAENLPFKTPDEALIMASIVEKETGKRDERERVAAVFINRLRQGMRLQSDPTILYGLFGGQVSWGKPIQRNEIQSRTAHNTYQINGLPPTPICNPGRASILATLRPADTRDLYFVADGQGGHIFSETLRDHNSAVTTWRKVEKDIRAKQADAQQRAAATRTASDTDAAANPAPVPATANVPLPIRKPAAR
jgi:UPF0755 protein